MFAIILAFNTKVIKLFKKFKDETVLGIVCLSNKSVVPLI